MLDFIKDPTLDRYRRSFASGENLLLEGDNIQDLMILVQGRLDIVKGQRKVSALTAPGSLFGEVSFILNRQRTTTVTANGPVVVLQIPSGEVADFLQRFPVVLPAITQVLAKRLHEATEIRSGLQELCDRLPEAMVMTDRHRRLLAWNTMAETLYGRSWQQMHDASLDELFEDQPSYQQFLAALQAGKTIQERTLKVNHPTELWKFVSTNTTVMSDGHQQVQGYLLIGRDVTAIQRLQKKQEALQKCLRPALALLLCLALFFALHYPSWRQGKTLLDHRTESFRRQIVKEQQALGSELAAPLAAGELAVVRQILADHGNLPAAALAGITGLTLLNPKQVVLGATTSGLLPANQLGNRYDEFLLPTPPPLEPTLLFPDRPAAGKGPAEKAALAFPLADRGANGYLLLRLDLNLLEKEYGLTRKALTKIPFRR